MMQGVEQVDGAKGARVPGQFQWVQGTLHKAGNQITFAGPAGAVPIKITDGTVAAKALAAAADGTYLETRIGGSYPSIPCEEQRFDVTQIQLGQLQAPPPPPPRPVAPRLPGPGFGAPGVYIVEGPPVYISRTRRC
jgi:hypothetical protein